MDEKKIREAISSFSGNINSAFILTCDLGDSLDFDLDFNFSSSNSLQRFTNVVRNMIQKGIVEKPVKSGRTLILDERSVLQLLVGRKYLGAGCSMNVLAGYLVGMTTDQIYDRLFAKQLPDIDKLARRNFISLERPDVKAALEKAGDELMTKYPVYHYIKIKPDLYLHLKIGKYSPSEMDEMVSLLIGFLEGKTRSES